MKVYNTLSGQKEEFQPQGDEVRMYVCGVNPYSDAHIGHAMSYVFFDVVRRYLEYRGYKVRHVQNITDVEDNIIDTASRLGIPVHELTDKYTARYDEDMDALNVTRADVYPKATEEIPKIIEIVEGLIDKGYAYEVGGSVYFRVRKVDDYGKLSRRSVESMMATEGAVGSGEKESPLDFALWKVAKPGEPSWDSPWGKGRPGWHIECSAMSLKYLGETLDIHGGGQDLIFPHHENEITQSESFTGKKPFVKYWMHNGMVQMGEEKMSKSLGNLITIREALERYGADGIRVFVLNSHYRSPLTYSEEVLEAAERGAERLRQTGRGEGGGKKGDGGIDVDSYRQRFIEAMDDDFNTAQALATLFDVAREINRADEAGGDTTEARGVLVELAGVLGLTLEEAEEKTLEEEIYKKSKTLEEYAVSNFNEAIKPIEDKLPQLNKNEAEFTSLIRTLRNEIVHGTYPDLDQAESFTRLYSDALTALRNQLAHGDFKEAVGSLTTLSSNVTANIGSLSDFREQLRKEKKWAQADMIRSKLNEVGIALEDTPQGTVWKRKR